MRIDVTYAGQAPRVIETAGESILTSSVMERSPEWLGTGVPVMAAMLRPRTDLLRNEGSGLVVELCAWSAAEAADGACATVADLGNATQVPRLLFHVFRVWEVLPAEDVAKAVAIDIDGRIHVRRVGGRLLDLTAYERFEADLLSGTERNGLALDQRVLLVHERLGVLHPGMSDAELGGLYGLGDCLHGYALSLADGGKGHSGGGRADKHSDLVDSLVDAGSFDERVDVLVDAILLDEGITLDGLGNSVGRLGADVGDLAELWAEAEGRIADEAGWEEPDWEDV